MRWSMVHIALRAAMVDFGSFGVGVKVQVSGILWLPLTLIWIPIQTVVSPMCLRKDIL
jgi:hypothetical protein